MAEAAHLSSGEAARRLGISKQTLLRAVRRGEIEPILQTPGGYLRFLRADVEAYAGRLSPSRRAAPGEAGVRKDSALPIATVER